MSDAWGLDQRPAKPARRARAARGAAAAQGDGAGRPAPGLSPKASAAAHRGIVWLHLGAIAVWLLVAGLLGALMAAGKNVPVAVVVAGVGAALGHGIFLASHLYLESRARPRAAAVS